MAFKILLVGTGNVAHHLAKRYSEKGHSITIVSRSEEKGQQFNEDLQQNFPIISDPDTEIPIHEFVILCVPDQQIVTVLETYAFQDAVVLHASGAVDLNVLQERTKNSGVLYPFQTFSKNKPVDFSKIPILIESSNSDILNQIHLLAYELGPNVYELDSPNRLKVHLAAVFASNFTNHMLTITESLLKDTTLTLKDFDHLVHETINKSFELGPLNAQTGPAKRNDQNVMKKHQELLKDPELKKLYELVSHLITKNS